MRVYQERRLDGIHRDAADGVADFEKNLMRLGLGGASTSSSAAQPLRAIPATDKGARSHFVTLEQRVEELEFRPSNNIKMMKELRERRKAQLAAEKDRRLRRRKSAGDQAPESVSTGVGPLFVHAAISETESCFRCAISRSPRMSKARAAVAMEKALSTTVLVHLLSAAVRPNLRALYPRYLKAFERNTWKTKKQSWRPTTTASANPGHCAEIRTC